MTDQPQSPTPVPADDPFAQTPPTDQHVYPSQPSPPAYGPPRRTSGFAIASMVLGILGTGIIAVIVGHVAMNDIKKTGKDGKGMAIAGLVLGYITTAFWTIFWIAVLAVGASTSTSPSAFEPAPASEVSALYDDCASGDMYACDQLYVESPLGSDEEAFGDDCGGLGHQVGAWCSDRGQAEFG